MCASPSCVGAHHTPSVCPWRLDHQYDLHDPLLRQGTLQWTDSVLSAPNIRRMYHRPKAFVPACLIPPVTGVTGLYQHTLVERQDYLESDAGLRSSCLQERTRISRRLQVQTLVAMRGHPAANTFQQGSQD
jgi:hypothetical protein